MKLFKKRDTTIVTSSSPSGSLEKSSIHQSPTAPSVSSQTSRATNGHNTPTNGNPSGGALQYPWSSKKIGNHNPFPRYGHATNAQTGRVRCCT